MRDEKKENNMNEFPLFEEEETKLLISRTDR